MNTVKGARDRRMRLHADVAGKFFGLQDMLGYKEANETMAWLLVQAKSDIEKLRRIKGSISERQLSSVKKKKIIQSRKTCSNLANYFRERAGIRARKRIRKIPWIHKSDKSKLSDDLNQLRSWHSFEAGEGSHRQNHDKDHSLKVLAHEVKEPGTHDHQPEYLRNQEEIVDDASVIVEKRSPSVVFNDLHYNVTPQKLQHQFANFQFFGKP